MREPRTDLPSSLRPPEPSAELRSRVIAAARPALSTERPDLWERIRGNRTARLAWAVSVGCLLFGHVVVSNGDGGGPPPPALPLAVVADSGDELAEVAALPRLTAPLPGFEIAPEDRGATPDQDRDSEERS